MLKHRAICVLLAFVLVFTGSIIFNTDCVDAATGTKDSLITHAKSHLGDRYNTFNDRSAFSTDWCAQFIQHCSAKAGLGAKIPTSGCSTPNDMAYNIVNKKGGKITFVNKNFYNNKKGNFTASSRVSYNTNYKPRKGDLIIFSSDADYWWTHIGVVTADSSYPLKNVSTIEGNTGNDSFTKSVVATKKRTSEAGFYIVAYVTPKYGNSVDLTAANVASTGSVKLTWSKYPKASKYYVYAKKSSASKYTLVKKTTGTTYTHNGTSGYLYNYKVKAISSKGKVLNTSAVVSKTCDLKQPKITGISNVASTGKIKVSWADVKNANKYRVYQATSKNGKYSLAYTSSKLKTNTGKSHSVTLSDQTPGTTYFYKIQAVTTSNSGADSALSSYAYQTCDLARPTVTIINQSNGNITLKWNAISKADKYEVYRAASKNGTYSKIGTVIDKTFTDKSKFTNGATYYYKVRALMNNNSYATSAFSTLASVKYKAPANVEPSEDTTLLVTETEYKDKYTDSSKYAAIPVYRYATRQKEYTTSGYTSVNSDNENPWTKYDSKTTSVISSWMWTKPTAATTYANGSRKDVSLYSTNYYYYFYGTAQPGNTSKWTWYVNNSRSSVVSHLKSSYSDSSVWSESRLRYFWKLSSTKKTTLDVANTTVNYVNDSTVSKGYFKYSGTYKVPNNVHMYYYKPVYKSKTVTTTNYFWRWGNWSGWSDWTTENKAASDTLKKDSVIMYRITTK